MINKSIAALLLSVTFSGCQMQGDGHASHEEKELQSAVCNLTPTAGNNARGMITFTSMDGSVKVEADLFNLSPGDHGFHIHEWGDISAADGSACGGHFNPGGHEHAGRDSHDRHMGDLGNLTADRSGYAHAEFFDEHIELGVIVGRSIIVHAGPDDFKSQPSGNSGPRIAQGVIGIRK